jgi:hypothetical protein
MGEPGAKKPRLPGLPPGFAIDDAVLDPAHLVRDGDALQEGAKRFSKESVFVGVDVSIHHTV